MKTVIETLTIDPEKYDLTRIAPLDQLLFVDIERKKRFYLPFLTCVIRPAP